MKMISAIVFLLFLFICSYSVLAQSPTERLILATLTSNGYSHREAKLWVKVSKVETDNYKSNLFCNHNNMWGMNFVRRGRKTTCLYRVWYNGRPTRFAGFKTPEDGVQDLVYWLDHVGFPKDFKDINTFCQYMKKNHYFEESYDQYFQLLKSK